MFLALLPATAGAAQLPPMDAPASGERILVVSPHPDDESLCCAGYLQRAYAAGAAVAIVWLTAGDSFELDALGVERHFRVKGLGMRRLGEERMQEAREAGRRLGIPPEQLFLLGYPDRSLPALAGNFMAAPRWSSYTATNRVPYSDAFVPDSAYTGENLLRDLGAVIDRFAPTRILVSAPEDLHPDHATAPEFVRRALARRGIAPRVHYFIIHAGRSWPRPRGLNTTLELQPPPNGAGRQWRSFQLTSQEAAGKHFVLTAHRTQMDVMRPFLNAFVRSNELFAD
jgi:LmbE family N-acetylglucosaminyl deacetylase